jgi:hypothetical protein
LLGCSGVLNSAITLPRLLLLVVLGSAGLVWAVSGARQPRPAVAHTTSAFSMWSALRQIGCAPPNEHGTFIARKLLPDEHGDPYIFECTADGLAVDGAHLR